MSRSFIIRSITAALLSGGLVFSFLYTPPIVLSLLFTAILTYILICEWHQLCIKRNALCWLLTPLYPVAPFVALIALNESSQYRLLVLILFATTAAFDTGAYLVGSFVGTHRIAPYVSPNKTWEGLWGGIIVTGTLLYTLAWYLDGIFMMGDIAICTLIASGLCFAGDLFESLLKRHAGVKDTGEILPGHGGFLDRFDSILFAIWFFYLARDYLAPIFGIM